jgi:hypothetical protein
MENDRVYFSYKDYQEEDESGKAKVKETDLAIMDFIQRFLLHVLPSGFQKVRYYGLLSSAARKTKLQKAYLLLGHTVQHTMRTIKEILKHLLGRDIDVCEVCGATHFVTKILLPDRMWKIKNITWNAGRAPPYFYRQLG